MFGQRAGDHAAAATRSKEFVNLSEDGVRKKEENRIQQMLDRPNNNDRVGSIRLGMGESLNRNLAVYRNQSGMEETIYDLRQLKERYAHVPVDNKGSVFNTDLVFALELGFMLDCAETITSSALERKDSRGAQARTDYPDRDDENWMKHIVVNKGEEGPELSYLPVSITQWTPEERKY